MQETSCHKSKVIKRRIYCFSWHLHFSYKKKSGSINFERNKIFDQKKRAMSQKDKTKLRHEIHNSETSTISRKIIQKWKWTVHQFYGCQVPSNLEKIFKVSKGQSKLFTKKKPSLKFITENNIFKRYKQIKLNAIKN